MQDETGTSCEKNVETDDSDSGRSDSSYVRIVDAAYKKRVMDDLDALLADLQSTTAHISSYQNNQRQQQQQSTVAPTPPPPNGNQRTYDAQDQPQLSNNNGYNSNSIRYQQQQQHPYPTQHHHNHQQQQQFPAQPYSTNQQHLPPPPSSNTGTNVYYTIENVNSESEGRVGNSTTDGYGYVYNSGGEEESNASSTPPPLPPPPSSEVLDSLAHAQRREIVSLHQNPTNPQAFHEQQPGGGGGNFDPDSEVQTRSEVKGRGERMSALSNNLSELDQLLQDLNSAQFMAEVDRKSTVNDIPVVVNGISNNNNNFSGSNKPPPPQVAPKPKRNTVDSLLDELESTPKFPVDPAYQELGPANHAYHPSSSSSSSSSSFPHQSASSATKELDDLMMSLSEFKVQDKDSAQDVIGGGAGEPTYAKPIKSRTSSATSPISPVQPVHGTNNATQLESMLGDLQSDMSRQGVNTKQKGVCAACNKPIVGQVIAALGQTWHIEHFTCAHCEEPLGTRNFYERDGMAYCETDYHHLFAPRCAYCNGPIVDKCITALEKMWHPEHFFCAQCGHPFGEEDFHEKNGKAYCRDDYFAMFAPKCGGCGQPIMENYISALNRQWHPECFVCWDCRSPFGTGSFFDYEGLPYCETHYHAKKGSLCASCEKPITGRCITAMFKKFHPEHFVCAFCLKQLNKGTFKEQNDKPYCHPCFVKLFG